MFTVVDWHKPGCFNRSRMPIVAARFIAREKRFIAREKRFIAQLFIDLAIAINRDATGFFCSVVIYGAGNNIGILNFFVTA